MRRLGFVLLLALASDAFANGRPPQTSTITFRPGMEQHILAGMSFGLLRTDDGGTTWKWMCEDALPYGGMYDPDYAWMNSGTYFATTFDGLKVNRDGCVFQPTVLAPPDPDLKFFSTIARGPDNALYVAAADPKDGKIYKSTDDGMSFPTTSMPGMLNDWWQSLEVSPSDAQRLYLSGYRFVQISGGGTMKQFLLFTSANGGTSWSPLPITDFTLMSNSTLEIVGIHPTNPQIVYARVTLEDNAIADAIYKSTNGGTTWTRILGKPTVSGSIAFLVRFNGDIVAGTENQGSFKSVDAGMNWTPLTGAPHINCLVENTAHEVWACTQNYGNPQVPMDGFGIMKSTDLTSWTGVLKYQNIDAPVACPMTSLQYTKCDNPAPTTGPLGWCGLCSQLGCDPKRDCNATGDGALDGVPKPNKGSGCCDTNGGASSGAGVLALGTAIGIVLLRRRRRRAC
jgi:photosystem II stability/assembly factor-like uncharacterized protein